MGKTVVLYHGGSCADGFASAWVVSRALAGKVWTRPVQYQQEPPEAAWDADTLYIVDFSYPNEILAEFAKRTKRIFITDHHKTAELPLQEFAVTAPESVTVRFDLEKSGAVLTWELLHPGEPIPILLQYVQDRDLWQWRLEESRAVSALIQSIPFNFNDWDWLSERLEGGHFRGVVKEGEAILRYQQIQVKIHVSKAALWPVGGETVPVVNATTLMSEIGEALCQAYPDRPFSATYFVREDGAKIWSLRSKNGFDVGAFARKLGGGGHPAAAGFVETPRGF